MVRRNQQGFTLIEMLVALTVFSLAALALIRLEGASLRGATAVDRSLLAGIVARNVAVEALTSPQPPALGTSQGVENNGGRQWRWSRIVEPLGDGNALKIDIAVSDAQASTAAKLMIVRGTPRTQAPTPAAPQ
jgi:general secretion pathway protein I